MRDSDDKEDTHLFCPVCSQSVTDPSKIRPDLARALVLEQMWMPFIHEAGTHLGSMFGYLDLIMNKPGIRDDPESRHFFERVLSRLRDHRTFLHEQLDFFRQLKNDCPLIEEDLTAFH